MFATNMKNFVLLTLFVVVLFISSDASLRQFDLDNREIQQGQLDLDRVIQQDRGPIDRDEGLPNFRSNYQNTEQTNNEQSRLKIGRIQGMYNSGKSRRTFRTRTFNTAIPLRRRRPSSFQLPSTL